MIDAAPLAALEAEAADTEAEVDELRAEVARLTIRRDNLTCTFELALTAPMI